ncbi:hypothetical protein DFH28DRAFT_930751 [Melampsora americana]|nr:hypothetical protein DFH28DRAFT_930751 [Melampsora americana]
MSGRKKVVSNKDIEAGSVINMLTTQSQETLTANNNQESQKTQATATTSQKVSSGGNHNQGPTSTIQRGQGSSATAKSSGHKHSQGAQLQTNVTGEDNSSTPQEPLQSEKGLEVQPKVIETVDKTAGNEGNQGKDLVNPDYLSLLGDKPIANKGGLVTIHSDNDDELDQIDLTDKNAVFAKAMALSVAGEGKQAAKYLKIYKKLSDNLTRPVTQRTNSAMIALIDNLQLRPTSQRSNTENPPTILREGMPEGAVFENDYGGLPYANKWLLDYGDWSLYYDTFVAVLSTKFKKFSEWAIAHKANVVKVLASMGWMTALKYDMRVRENALINRVEVDGKVAPPDISEYDQQLAEECWSESRMRDELSFKKNPYIEGGERETWDPATGKPPKKTFERNTQNRMKPYQRWNNYQKEDQPTQGSSSTQTREKKKFKKGYQGNNFDENFAEKKAASAAAAKEAAANK